MDWPFYIRPIPPLEEFSPEALAAIHARVRTLPTLADEAGNDYALFLEFETRDLVRARGSDVSGTVLDSILVEPKGIVIWVAGWTETIAMIAQLATWCMSQWPCVFLDHREAPIAPEVFIDKFLLRGQPRN